MAGMGSSVLGHPGVWEGAWPGDSSLSHLILLETLSSDRAGAPRGCLGNPQTGAWTPSCGAEPRYPSNCGRKAWSDPWDEGPFRRGCPPDVGA